MRRGKCRLKVCWCPQRGVVGGPDMFLWTLPAAFPSHTCSLGSWKCLLTEALGIKKSSLLMRWESWLSFQLGWAGLTPVAAQGQRLHRRVSKGSFGPARGMVKKTSRKLLRRKVYFCFYRSVSIAGFSSMSRHFPGWVECVFSNFEITA